MSKSFKEMLNEKHSKEVEAIAKPIIVDMDVITKSSENATLEDAEKIWPVLEASLDLDKGYGLAAIQIGIPKKVAIIHYNGKVYRLLNTRIVKAGSTTPVYNEGCLSIPGKTVHTERHINLTVQDDALGEVKMNMSKDGLLPIIFQHEIDHFEGKTIFDHVRKPIKRGSKVGRNAPCPCGSGKKFKKCGCGLFDK